MRRIVETARDLRRTAERLEVESSQRWTPQSTMSLDALTERLVASLLPNLAAAEAVLTPFLDAESKEGTTQSHRRIRRLAERLAAVSEAVSRSRRPQSVSGQARAVLRALIDALKDLEDRQEAAVAGLEATLSGESLAEVVDSLAAAGREARTHILLVTGPEVAPTEATVLRSRPDLDRAYATNLAELETGPARSA